MTDTPTLIDPAGDTRYPLPEGVTRVGRASDCDVVLEHPWVSREHCVIVRLGGTVRVHDRSDGNTRIDGQPVTAGQVLTDDQTLSIGALDLRLAPKADAPTAPTARPARSYRDAVRLCAALAASGLLAIAGVVGSASAPQATGDTPARVAETTPSAPAVVDRRVAEYQIPLMTSVTIDQSEPVTPATQAAPRPTPEPKTAPTRPDDKKRLIEARRLATQLHGQLKRARQELAAARRDRDQAIADRAMIERVALAPKALSTEAEAEAVARKETPTADRPNLPQLHPRRLARLVAQLNEVIDDFASPMVRPDDLRRPLVRLTGAAGPEPAKALLAAHAHARKLVDEWTEKLAQDRRNHGMLKAKLGTSQSKDIKRGKLVGRGSKEERQRELEVLARIVELREGQLARLKTLDAAVVEAIARLAAPEAVGVLSTELAAQVKRPRARRDTAVVAVILRRLAASTWGRRQAASTLMDHLNVRDRRLRAEVRDALLELCSTPPKKEA